MPREIPLTQGKVAIVDDADYEWLNQWRWRAHKRGHTFYATRWSPRDGNRRRMIHMHRLLLVLPPDMEADHINGSGLDNRRINLRVCTHTQNQMNRQKYGSATSSYKGVSWCKQTNQWRGDICRNGKHINLGRFADEQDAARAYNAAAREHFGEFAKLNIIEEESQWTN